MERTDCICGSYGRREHTHACWLALVKRLAVLVAEQTAAESEMARLVHLLENERARIVRHDKAMAALVQRHTETVDAANADKAKLESYRELARVADIIRAQRVPDASDHAAAYDAARAAVRRVEGYGEP